MGKLGPFRLQTREPHWKSKLKPKELPPLLTWYTATLSERVIIEFQTRKQTESKIDFNGKVRWKYSREQRFSQNPKDIAKWLLKTAKMETEVAQRTFVRRLAEEKRLEKQLRKYLE